MGLLDSVLGALAGAPGGGSGSGAGGGQADLLRVVVGMLAQGGQGSSGGGGLGDLIGRFQQGGLGHLVDSWVGTCENLPISADQLGGVLGSDTLSQIAGQLGLSHGDTADQLSRLLPQVLDRLTPDGNVPDGGLGDVASVLARLGGR